MQPAELRRLAATVDRFGAPATAVEPLARILDLQAVDPTASTTVRDPSAALDRHVADSLVALDFPVLRSARAVADIGSGAGWPGLALAAALPEVHVRLVEAASRHVRYLERAVEAGRLPNVELVHARAEAWPEGLAAHDVVTARALAPLGVVLEYGAPLLRIGGHLLAWKGELEPAEATAARAAASALGMELVEVRHVMPFAGARSRTLHVARKTAPTPERFPRRPGMATKRPLGARP